MDNKVAIMAGLAVGDLHRVSVIEKSASAFSILCILITLGAHVFIAHRRRGISNLIVYASIGNLMTEIALMLGSLYVSEPDSVGCQAQAIIIQVFMSSDAYWAFFMALEVARDLPSCRARSARGLKYSICLDSLYIYSIGSVVALSLIIWRDREHRRPLGDTVFRCWITTDFDAWRIPAFYGPVWAFYALTCTIWIYVLFRYHAINRNISQEVERLENSRVSQTQIKREQPQLGSLRLPRMQWFHRFATPFRPNKAPSKPLISSPMAVRSIGLSQEQQAAHQGLGLGPHVPLDMHRLSHTNNADNEDSHNNDVATTASRRDNEVATTPSHTSVSNPIAPSVDDRPLLMTSLRAGQRPIAEVVRQRKKLRATKARLMLFRHNFIIALLSMPFVLVVWFPCSANTIYSTMHGGSMSRNWMFASAAVSPLQGVFNAILYFIVTHAKFGGFRHESPGRMCPANLDENSIELNVLQRPNDVTRVSLLQCPSQVHTDDNGERSTALPVNSQNQSQESIIVYEPAHGHSFV